MTFINVTIDGTQTVTAMSTDGDTIRYQTHGRFLHVAYSRTLAVHSTPLLSDTTISLPHADHFPHVCCIGLQRSPTPSLASAT